MLLEFLPIVKETVDRKNPRVWYSALMDYGCYIKKVYGNPNKNSSHYAAQSKFEGSDRQLRGAAIRELISGESASVKNMYENFPNIDRLRISRIFEEVAREYS